MKKRVQICNLNVEDGGIRHLMHPITIQISENLLSSVHSGVWKHYHYRIFSIIQYCIESKEYRYEKT